MKVFVYGTLKKGFGADISNFGDVTFIGNATAKGKMFSCGGFPAVLFDKEGEVKGEVYEVNDNAIMNRLDRYEGVPNLYIRKDIEVTKDDGDTESVMTYHYNCPTDNLKEVASGEWVR